MFHFTEMIKWSKEKKHYSDINLCKILRNIKQYYKNDNVDKIV